MRKFERVIIRQLYECFTVSSQNGGMSGILTTRRLIDRHHMWWHTDDTVFDTTKLALANLYKPGAITIFQGKNPG